MANLKGSGETSIHAIHTWKFTYPAGRRFQFTTMTEPSKKATRELNDVHGDGQTGPVFIADGNGGVDWSATVTGTEWAALERLMAGTEAAMEEWRFDWTTEIKAGSLPKNVDKAIGCKIGDLDRGTAGDGNMNSISGKAMNARANGVWFFKVPE